MIGINLPEPYQGLEEDELRVELDKKALFALASDTRMDILKSLQPNRRTVSQLAELVGVDKAAVHRHLKKLEDGGFVKREEDHGFVYYGLSWKARDILSPNENTKIVVLITASILLIGAVILMTAMVHNANPILNGDSSLPTAQPQQGDTSVKTGQDLSQGSSAGTVTDWLASMTPLFVAATISVILVLLAYRKGIRPRQKDPPLEPESYGEPLEKEDD
jgi:DNA-binding transcriptional ArsR family regulator